MSEVRKPGEVHFNEIYEVSVLENFQVNLIFLIGIWNY